MNVERPVLKYFGGRWRAILEDATEGRVGTEEFLWRGIRLVDDFAIELYRKNTN